MSPQYAFPSPLIWIDDLQQRQHSCRKLLWTITAISRRPNWTEGLPLLAPVHSLFYLKHWHALLFFLLPLAGLGVYLNYQVLH